MNYFRRIFILIVVIFVSLTGCEKNEANKTNFIPKSLTNEFASLKNYSRSKLSDAEYDNINWAKFDSSILKNGDAVYSFGAERNKNVSFIFLKTSNKVNGKMITLKLENGILATTVYDMETGLNYTRNDKLNQASSTVSSNRTGDPSTLPPVVVVHYINSNSTVNFNLSIQFIGGGGSGYDWNYVAETGYIANDEPVIDPPIGGNEPVLEFVDVNEALAFFAWEQSLSSEELAVLAQYPWAAVPIYRAAQKALAKAEEWAAAHPGVGNGITDGRADAIRHAYWNALMTSDVGSAVAIQFSTAHEIGSTKPATMSQSLYNLERQMDLHNNSAGSDFALTNNYGTFTSAEAIWYDLTTGVGSLGLKYICAAGGPGSETLKDYYASCP